MRVPHLITALLLSASAWAQLPFSFSGSAGGDCAPQLHIEPWPGTIVPANAVQFDWSTTNATAAPVLMQVRVYRDTYPVGGGGFVTEQELHSFTIMAAPNTTTTGTDFWPCASTQFQNALGHSVRVYGPNGTCTAFSMTVTGVLPAFANDAEGNNSFGTGPLTTLNTDYDGHLHFNGTTDDDWYRIQLPAQGKLVITLQSETPESTAPTIEAFLWYTVGTFINQWGAPTGTNNVPNTNVFEQTCVGGTGGGQYYLRIRSVGGCDISYRLTLSLVSPVFATDPHPNSTPGTPVAHNTYQDGQIKFDFQNNTYDFFNLVPPFNGVMNIEVQAEHAGPSASTMTVALLSTAGLPIETWTVPSGANGVPITSTMNVTCRSSTTDYDLRFSSTACGASYRFKYVMTQPVYANDLEPNGNTGGSTEAHDTWYEGQIGFDNQTDDDIYNLVPPFNGVMNIEFLAEHAGAAVGTVNVALLTTAGLPIQTWNIAAGANGAPQSTIVTVPCRGSLTDYDLRFSDVTCGVSYRWKYWMTPAVFANDPEPNNSAAQAIILPEGQTAQGQVNFDAGDNTDSYRANLSSDGVMHVTIEAEHAGTSTTGTIQVQLYISNGSVLQTWTAPVGATSTTISTTFSETCRGNGLPYYLRVSSDICGTSYRISYSVTPPVYTNDPEPNNSSPGTAMDLNAANQQGHIGFYNTTDDDFYAFTHPGGPWSITVSAEHAGTGEGTMSMVVINNPGTVFGTFTVPVGGSSTALTNTFTIPSLAAGSIYRVRLLDVTCGVSYRLHCYDTDADGTCNAFDLCAGGPEPGTPCDDLNACTANDVIQTGCNCAGTPTIDSDGDGTCDAADGCPADPDKTAPGICGCGVSDVDTDGDLTADCNDGCPNDPNKIAPGICGCGVSDVDTDGDLTADCNDGCPNDPNKIAPGICGCGVSDADTDGDLTADCNDGCPNDANKTAPGICGCGVSDVDSDGDLTADCNDGCPADPNKTAPGICGCGVSDVDTDGDLTADCNDGCPNDAAKNSPGTCGCGNPEPGATCNDNNANTNNDVIGANCICAGTPIGGGCTTNELTLEIGADGLSNIMWEVRMQGSGALVASGGQTYPNGSFNESICVPDGCYYLRVLDDNNDGITGGGYLLRTITGKRIIDNTGNFGTGSVSAILNNGGFCLPLGNDRLVTSSCDRLELRRGVNAGCSDKITADNTPNGTSGNVYQFWFFDPNGTLSLVYPSTNGATSNQVSMANLPSLVEGRLYNVRVRTRISAGVWRNWGTACRMRIDNVAGQCASTQLQNQAGTQHTCGVTKPLGNGGANRVYAKPVTRFNANCVSVAANRYQFRFRIPAEGITIVKTGVSNNPWTYLNMANVVATPIPASATLEACRTYDVEVRASFDGGATWCRGGDPYTDLALWGNVCDLSTDGCNNELQMLMEDAGDDAQLSMFPNPNRGDHLTLRLTGIEEIVSTVSVDIFDTFGKRVSARTIPVADGFVNTTMELNGELAAGLYVVNITAGDAVYTQRLLIQP